MVKVNLLAFRDGKKQRCLLCNRLIPIANLALFHEDGVILGDLHLCAECSEALDDALLNGSTVREFQMDDGR